jgi:hypothetical protein
MNLSWLISMARLITSLSCRGGARNRGLVRLAPIGYLPAVHGLDGFGGCTIPLRPMHLIGFLLTQLSLKRDLAELITFTFPATGQRMTLTEDILLIHRTSDANSTCYLL